MAEENRKFMKSDSSYDDSFRAEYLHPRYWGLWLLAPLLFVFAWMPVCIRDAFGRLLAGIVLDTKNFTVRVNSRTFEAAAFLQA